MSNEASLNMQLVLSRGVSGSRLTVDLQSFLRFNADMDHDLDRLIKRWSDYATPASRRTAGGRPLKRRAREKRPRKPR
jgi:hypothetical protein